MRTKEHRSADRENRLEKIQALLKTLLAFPRVEDGHAQILEMPCIAGGNGEAVFKGSGGKKAVDISQGFSLLLGLGGEYSPTVGNGLADGQKIVSEPSVKIAGDPQFKLAAFFAEGEKLNAFANLSDAENAGKKRMWWCRFHPALDVRVGGNGAPAEFGKHVGIEQEVGHSSSGRP